jgi:hypothetical protein
MLLNAVAAPRVFRHSRGIIQGGGDAPHSSVAFRQSAHQCFWQMRTDF